MQNARHDSYLAIRWSGTEGQEPGAVAGQFTV